MKEEILRTGLLIGEEGMNKLSRACVAIFGIGGVGGYVTEALARCNVGSLVLIDNDVVSLSNINRQIIALHSTVGQYKTEVMKNRILDINPEAKVTTYNCFYLPENDEIDFTQFDYVIDCIDTVAAKIALVLKCQELGIPIIASMGTGNKLNPSKLEITDIYKTSVCPLAKVMRHELKKRHVKKLKVCYSTEYPIKVSAPTEGTNRRSIPGSTSFVPSSAGLLIASEVVRDLTKA